ncbi:MAG: helix-turn-helix domain-containing protein [Burkholderiales bacterium]|nr:helix-turn-helix domain-containing protein [Burkholderiales bacterium]
MSQHVLDPANEAEAEMAATARALLMAALDHSKANEFKLTLEGAAPDQDAPVLVVPPRALRLFADVLRQMAKREPMLLVPQKSELTTQEAASFLNVSRPFVIKEIEAGRIRCRLVNRHRRVEFEELLRYKEAQKQRSEDALRQLRQLSDDMGEEL